MMDYLPLADNIMTSSQNMTRKLTAAPKAMHEQGWGIVGHGYALEGYHYSWAMVFGSPVTQLVIFAQLVPHLLSAKVEGDGCHLVCCHHIVLVAATYPSMHGCFAIGHPSSSHQFFLLSHTIFQVCLQGIYLKYTLI